jgi:hypothetical protein
MSPTENTIGLVPDDTKEIVTYYSSCNGTNPLQEPLLLAFSYNQQMKDTLDTLTNPSSTFCPNDPELQACYSDVEDIYATLYDISVSASCAPIQEQSSDASDDGVCNYFFNAVLYLWVSQYIGMICIFVLLCGAVSIIRVFKYIEDLPTEDDNTTTAEPSAPEFSSVGLSLLTQEPSHQ